MTTTPIPQSAPTAEAFAENYIVGVTDMVMDLCRSADEFRMLFVADGDPPSLSTHDIYPNLLAQRFDRLSKKIAETRAALQRPVQSTLSQGELLGAAPAAHRSLQMTDADGIANVNAARVLMTEEQKQFCRQTAQWMERIKTFPGGTRLLANLFQAAVSTQGLTLVDENNPMLSMRRIITQELYDALWATRELRKSGYTMQTAGKIGIADLYAAHGSQGLVRYIECATNAALHNAGLDGFSRSQKNNEAQ